MVTHCGFTLHFPEDWGNEPSFHGFTGHSYIFFCKVQITCPLFYWIVLSLYYWAIQVLHIFWVLVFDLMCILQIFFSSLWLVCFCLRAEVFHFDGFSFFPSLIFVLRNLCLSSEESFRRLSPHIFSPNLLQLSMVSVADFCRFF